MICWKRIFFRKNRHYSVDARSTLWEQEYSLQSQVQDLGQPIKITLPDETVIIGNNLHLIILC